MMALRLGTASICLITPGQPSSNPRIVKEGDALAAAGYDVHIIAQAADWCAETDRALIQSRGWRCDLVGGDARSGRMQYAATRLRHGLSRRALRGGHHDSIAARCSLARAAPELARAALAIRADLYIGSYPAGLDAAARAGRSNHVPFAYDAEDFLPGLCPPIANPAHPSYHISAGCVGRARNIALGLVNRMQSRTLTGSPTRWPQSD